MTFVPLVPPPAHGPVFGRAGFDPHPAVGAFILSAAVVLMGWNIFPMIQKAGGGSPAWGLQWIKIGFGLLLWFIGMAFLARARYLSWSAGLAYGAILLPGLILLLWHTRHNNRHSAWDTQEQLSQRYQPMKSIEVLRVDQNTAPAGKANPSGEGTRAMRGSLSKRDPAGAAHRQFSPREIVRLLRQHLEDGRPMTTICHEQGIGVTTFLEWQEKMQANGGPALARPPLPRRIATPNEKYHQMEARLRQKDEIIASLTEELVRIRKELLER